MKQGRKSRVGLLIRGLVVISAFSLWCMPALGQGGGGGAGGGGGGAGGGGAGGGGAGGGAGGAGTGTSSGTSSVGTGMIFGTTGSGSPGVTNPTGTAPISTVNPLNYYFASPTTAGYGSNVTLQSQNSIALSTAGGAGGTLVTGKGTFGVTDYKAPTAVQQATITVNNGIRATTAAAATATSTATNPGFTTMGTKRAAAYYTTVSPRMMSAPPSAGGLQTNLQTVFAQSSALPTAQNLNVSVDGQQTVLLRGTVGSEDERTMAEGLARLTPGVRAVDNQIQVRPK
jgi:hypothetical protein